MSEVNLNLFRSQYRTLSDQEKFEMLSLKDNATRLLGNIDRVPDMRYRNNAIKSLEEAVMWATKGITG